MAVGKLLSTVQVFLNIAMTSDELVLAGNQHREQNQPEQALACYAQAFVSDRNNFHAWNNYGNVLRELGDPVGAVAFLQRAITLDPGHSTAQFNLAVAYLLAGDYEQGWPQYEHRWNFEHLTGTLPQLSTTRWTGQDLKDKTILICQEQGLGDTIQFVRFLWDLHSRGAKIVLQVNSNLGALLEDSPIIDRVVNSIDEVEEFDYWSPIMSLPRILGVTLDKLSNLQSYIKANESLQKRWQEHLGPKHRLRVGFCWSGRRDTWLNQHKALPLHSMLELIKRNPNYHWINLQLDATQEETEQLLQAGVQEYSLPINNFNDTAALVANCDVILSVDTAVAHLSASMGRPTWIMLNSYATDWRWLLDKNNNPWYPTARLFRQSTMGDWSPVLNQIHKFLALFKI
jgi:ADP-heptose:LPS heptosyltransferase